MSDDNFVKLMTSTQAKELALSHPLAFAILSVAAMRAKWNEDSKSKLELGEAMIGCGDFEGHGKGSGMTRKQYRTNLNKLVNSGFAAIKTANKGTIIKILNTDIYDVSRKRKGHQNGQKRASKGPLTENIEVRIDIDKESVSIVPGKPRVSKIQFLDRVFLTQKEHDDLKAQCGDLWTAVLERLNNFIPNKKGEPYRCHASAIRTWVIKAVIEDAHRIDTLKALKKPSAGTSFIEEARKFAEETRQQIGLKAKEGKIKIPKGMQFTVESDHVMVGTPGGAAGDWTLRFEAHGFAQQLESRCRKLGIM